MVRMTSTPGTLPDPMREPTISAERTRKLYGLGRRQVYDALRAGQIPGRRIGGRWVVPTALVLRDLGLDGAVQRDGDTTEVA